MQRESSRDEQSKIQIGTCDKQGVSFSIEVALKQTRVEMVTGITQTDFTQDKEVKIRRQSGRKYLRFLNRMLKIFHQFKQFILKCYPP